MYPEQSKELSLYTSGEKVQFYLQSSCSESTKYAFKADWKAWELWCLTQNLPTQPITPEKISAFCADHAESHKFSTLSRRVKTLKKANRLLGMEYDYTLVRQTMEGIRRTHGSSQTRKTPLKAEELKDLIDCIPSDVRGARNRAALLVGFMGAFRRSEVLSLKYEDVQFVPEGMLITLRKSKTDQYGEGREIAIPYSKYAKTCAVRNLKIWLEESKITEGYIFRSITRGGNILERKMTEHSFAGNLKRWVYKAALKKGATKQEAQDAAKRVSGHSLRSGFVTSAIIAGVTESVIMRQTGHKSIVQLAKYVRITDPFEKNAASHLNL